MMNYENPTPTPNDLPVTMHEPAQDTAVPSEKMPFQDFALMASLLKALNTHIETLVDQRFAALVESHKTLALMDDGMEQRISQMIDDAIENHESDRDHVDEGQIEYLIEQNIRHNNDIVSEKRVGEIVNDALDEVLEDKVQDLLGNASVEITL